MDNKQQTAVEYLIHHIRQDVFVHSKSTKEWNQVFQQAKKMHKEQIEKAVNFGDERGNIVSYSTAEQYYNETYGDDKQ